MKLVSLRALRLRDRSDSVPQQLAPRRPSRLCVIELATDAGLTGTGFAELEQVPLIERLARELLLGTDPRGVTGLWQRMVDATSASPHAAASAAIGALDLALWDLKAKANDQPLWRALGASNPRVNVHARVAVGVRGAEGFAATFAALVGDSGLRGACLEASTDASGDERWLAWLRDALAASTDTSTLMLDLDERSTPKESARRIRALEREFDLTWVEAPARRMDCAGYRSVSEACSAAVCGGRWFGGPEDFLPHFRERSLDVVQIGFHNAGVTGALQIADTAFGFELPIAIVAAPGDLNAHVAAVLPLGMSLEIDSARGADGTVSGDVRIEAGWAHIGDRPGHGVVVDPAAFEPEAVAGGKRAQRS